MTTPKVKIYTLACFRPDFIPIQFNSIKRHLTDEFEFIVFNNEKPGNRTYDKNRRAQIFKICDELKIQCIDVEFDETIQHLNGEKAFDNGVYVNDNLSCAYGNAFAWKNYVSKWDCLGCIIDSDMFLIKDVSFVELMKGYDLGFIPSYRENCTIKYMWNGFVLADIPNLPNPEEIGWGCNKINGIAVDVGGENYYYLEKYKDQLKLRYWDQVGLLRDDTKNLKEICLNGCAPYLIDFAQGTLGPMPYNDPQALLPPNLKTFPHQTDREKYWGYFFNMFYRLNQISVFYDFPKPTYFDFIKAEEEDNINNSFIFHYKSATTRQSFQTDEYNRIKTIALEKLLKAYHK